MAVHFHVQASPTCLIFCWKKYNSNVGVVPTTEWIVSQSSHAPLYYYTCYWHPSHEFTGIFSDKQYIQYKHVYKLEIHLWATITITSSPSTLSTWGTTFSYLVWWIFVQKKNSDMTRFCWIYTLEVLRFCLFRKTPGWKACFVRAWFDADVGACHSKDYNFLVKDLKGFLDLQRHERCTWTFTRMNQFFKVIWFKMMVSYSVKLW